MNRLHFNDFMQYQLFWSLTVSANLSMETFFDIEVKLYTFFDIEVKYLKIVFFKVLKNLLETFSFIMC